MPRWKTTDEFYSIDEVIEALEKKAKDFEEELKKEAEKKEPAPKKEECKCNKETPEKKPDRFFKLEVVNGEIEEMAIDNYSLTEVLGLLEICKHIIIADAEDIA